MFQIQYPFIAELSLAPGAKKLPTDVYINFSPGLAHTSEVYLQNEYKHYRDKIITFCTELTRFVLITSLQKNIDKKLDKQLNSFYVAASLFTPIELFYILSIFLTVL